MSILDKRKQMLYVADFDYLSARILLNSGIPMTGLPKAAEALEKLLKLFLLLEAKISRGLELDSHHLKSFGHDLPKLLEEVADKIPKKFSEEWKDYFKELGRSYIQRYPDNWGLRLSWSNDVEKLDTVYSYFRENVIRNFPIEEQSEVKNFGVVLMKAFTEEVCQAIKKNGGRTPLEALKNNNKSIDRFNF